jgi:hypothetical protein
MIYIECLKPFLLDFFSNISKQFKFLGYKLKAFLFDFYSMKIKEQYAFFY